MLSLGTAASFPSVRRHAARLPGKDTTATGQPSGEPLAGGFSKLKMVYILLVNLGKFPTLARRMYTRRAGGSTSIVRCR